MSVARQLASSVARQVARSVVRSAGGGGSPTPSLDIKAHVGTSTSPTSTGTKAVTGVGFEPKAILPFGNSLAASGVNTSLDMALGSAVSSSNRACVSVSSVNAVTTSDTDRLHTSTLVYELLFGGFAFLRANLETLDSDGFTLNWSTASPTARILNHIALGGTDLEVSLTQHQMNNTNAPQSFAHGLTGGAPSALLFLSNHSPVAPPSTTIQAYFSLGSWANNGSQYGAFFASFNGQATASTQRIFRTGSVLPFSSQRTLNVSSVDDTNINGTYPVTVSTNQAHFWMLAIRGAKAQVGTFDCNGSLDPLTINCTGITPKLFMPIFVPSGVDSVGTVQNGLLFGIGASDGTNNVSCGITDANGVTTTNARRYQSSTSLVEYDTAGTKQFEATASFSGESVILDPATNGGSTWGQGAYLIIGA